MMAGADHNCVDPEVSAGGALPNQLGIPLAPFASVSIDLETRREEMALRRVTRSPKIIDNLMLMLARG